MRIYTNAHTQPFPVVSSPALEVPEGAADLATIEPVLDLAAKTAELRPGHHEAHDVLTKTARVLRGIFGVDDKTLGCFNASGYAFLRGSRPDVDTIDVIIGRLTSISIYAGPGHGGLVTLEAANGDEWASAFLAGDEDGELDFYSIGKRWAGVFGAGDVYLSITVGKLGELSLSYAPFGPGQVL